MTCNFGKSMIKKKLNERENSYIRHSKKLEHFQAYKTNYSRFTLSVSPNSSLNILNVSNYESNQ